MATLLLLNCKLCNNIFPFNPNSRERATFCPACKNLPDKKIKTLLCTKCGITITRKGTNHKYCQQCRAVTKKDRDKKRYHKQAKQQLEAAV